MGIEEALIGGLLGDIGTGVAADSFMAGALATGAEYGAGASMVGAGMTAAEAGGAMYGMDAATYGADLGSMGAMANGAGYGVDTGLLGSGGVSAMDMAYSIPGAGLPGAGLPGGGILGSGVGWGDVKSALQIAGPAMSIGSGIYGMSQADALRKQALLAQQKADPWGNSGGRALADTQLQDLMNNPSQVAARDPSYALRMQAASRANAQYGQDSGAMSVAAANASTDWYNQRLGQLSGLAGASQNPASAYQVGMTGQVGANTLASQSLASIGYGVTSAGGGNMGFTPAQLAALKNSGITFNG